jgi:hypothetical protein
MSASPQKKTILYDDYVYCDTYEAFNLNWHTFASLFFFQTNYAESITMDWVCRANFYRKMIQKNIDQKTEYDTNI